MRAAGRQFSKVMDECPFCRSNRPKELVEGEKKWNNFLVIIILLASPCTCFLSLFLIPLCLQATLEAYCDKCQRSFPLEG